MRVLLMLHPDFLPSEDSARADALAWVRGFANGVGGVIFRPLEHKVEQFDVVHLFSGRDPETWFELKRNGRKVVVTPRWPGGPPSRTPSLILLRVLRALRQRKWPPVDEDAFFNSPDAILDFEKGFPRELAAASVAARRCYGSPS